MGYPTNGIDHAQPFLSPSADDTRVALTWKHREINGLDRGAGDWAAVCCNAV